MASIVAFEVGFPAPVLHQIVQIRHGKGLTGVLTGEQIRIIVNPGQVLHLQRLSVQMVQERLNGLDTAVVERHSSVLLRLLLFHFKPVARTEVTYLAESDRKQFRRPVGGIDANGEDGEVPRGGRQCLLDLVDRIDGPNWLDFDRITELGVIRVGDWRRNLGIQHFINFSANSYKT